MTRQRTSFFYISLAVIFSLLSAGSSFAYEKEINALSAAMAEKIAKAERTSVAVVDFTDLEGNVTQLGRFIAEEFSSALAGGGQRVQGGGQNPSEQHHQGKQAVGDRPD